MKIDLSKPHKLLTFLKFFDKCMLCGNECVHEKADDQWELYLATCNDCELHAHFRLHNRARTYDGEGNLTGRISFFITLEDNFEAEYSIEVNCYDDGISVSKEGFRKSPDDFTRQITKTPIMDTRRVAKIVDRYRLLI